MEIVRITNWDAIRLSGLQHLVSYIRNKNPTLVNSKAELKLGHQKPETTNYLLPRVFTNPKLPTNNEVGPFCLNQSGVFSLCGRELLAVPLFLLWRSCFLHEW